MTIASGLLGRDGGGCVCVGIKFIHATSDEILYKL